MVDEQEMVQEIQEEVVDELQQQPEPITPQPDPASRYKRDISNLRNKYEQAEREKSELIRLLQERQGNNSADNLDFTIGDDDIVEGKHISKVKKQMRSELSKMQEELASMKRQSNQLAAENKARSKYPDLDAVLSPDNIEMLKDIDPDAANSISNITDPYAQFTFAYLAIKEKVMNTTQTSYNIDKEQAKKNAAKPRAAAGMPSQQGESALSQANVFGAKLTPELKEQLRKEMDQYARRV